MKPIDMSVNTSARDRLWAWIDAGVLFLIAFLIRAYVCQRVHHISSDEFFYTVIARDIYGIWTNQLHSTVHGMNTLHPGGYPMVLAAVFYITGKPVIEVGQHFGTVVSVFAVAMTYWMVREAVGSRWIAFTAAFLMATMPGLIRDSDRVYTDNQATLLVTVAMASAFRSWRTGRVLPWVGACVGLGAAVLTKEYLLALTVPALGLGSLANIRMHRWTYWAALILVFIAVLAGVWYVQFRSTWLTQASYVTAEIHGERQDYVGRTAPSMKKLLSQQLAEADIPFVFVALAMLGLIMLFYSLARPLAVLPDGIIDSNLGAVIALAVVPLTFCLSFSMFENLWGARLVYPSFPAICALSAVGLLAVTGMPGLIGLVGVSVLSMIFMLMRPGLSAGYLGAACSIPLAAAALHAAHMRVPDTGGSLQVRKVFPYLALGLMLLASAVPGLSRIRVDLREQASRNYPFGPQFGMFRAADWIAANIGPNDNVVACNPRQACYFTKSRYAHLVNAIWWDSGSMMIEPEALRRHRVNWVLINRPETKPDRADRLYRHLKQRPDVREEYSLVDRQGVFLAVFRVAGTRNGR